MNTLDALFRPRSVALIGASDDPARTGGRPLRYLLEAGFKGAVYPVNTRRDTVQGLRAYASVEALPEIPDCALIAVPAEATAAAMRDCVAKGVRSAILFTAGFAELGEAGRDEQDKITAIAKQGGIRMLGPNCLGLYNAELAFMGTFGSILDRGFPKPGPIGIVSQSGAFGMYLAYVAQSRGLGVNYAITTGNEADIDVAECMLWMAHRPEVEIILGYAEGIRNGPVFIEALRVAHEARKPVIFTKVGASKAGAQAASSHTASLAGADEVFDAVLRQFGVLRAATTEEQLDMAYACCRKIYPKNNRLGIVTGSGGIGVQMCDVAEAVGLEVPALPLSAQHRITALLPFSSPANPIDVTAQALSDMTTLAGSLRVTLEEGGYGAIVAAFLGLPLARPFAGPFREALESGTEGYADRLVVLNVNADPDIVRDYEAKGFLVFEDATRAVRAIGGLHKLHQGFEKTAGQPPIGKKVLIELPEMPLSEHASKQILGAAGIPFLEEKLVHNADEAGAFAAIAQAPMAMKIVSPDILHKTEIGGVILDVQGEDAARAAYELLLQRAINAVKDARIEGVLMAPMAGEGVETIIGAMRDPVFGPVVMFGLGGIFAEVFKDVAFRLAPFDLTEARAMIAETKSFALLNGPRGTPPADIEALAAALVKISDFMAANLEQIESIDINPFLVRPIGQGAVALDALLLGRQPDHPPAIQ